ncbi:MAG: hypothetical protein KC964_26095 [Candidatus Omnitrophica bacterium]|nr:hypothetical protein [Candidatus Omnitrophota bacterium]
MDISIEEFVANGKIIDRIPYYNATPIIPISDSIFISPDIWLTYGAEAFIIWTTNGFVDPAWKIPAVMSKLEFIQGFIDHVGSSYWNSLPFQSRYFAVQELAYHLQKRLVRKFWPKRFEEVKMLIEEHREADLALQTVCEWMRLRVPVIMVSPNDRMIMMQAMKVMLDNEKCIVFQTTRNQPNSFAIAFGDGSVRSFECPPHEWERVATKTLMEHQSGVDTPSESPAIRIPGGQHLVISRYV